MTKMQPELARAIAATVFERHGIKLRENDAAFALVTINELVLRKVMAELLEQVDHHIKAALSAFQVTMQRAEGRAGAVLAQQVRDSAAGLQQTLRQDIGAAQLGAQRIVEQIQKTYRAATLARWCAVAAVIAIVMFACGFWAGRL